MAVEYREVAMHGNLVIYEKRSQQTYRAGNLSSRHVKLKEEIYALRTLMESTSQEAESFTSDLVVHVSSMLDKKINEYMRLSRKKS